MKYLKISDSKSFPRPQITNFEGYGSLTPTRPHPFPLNFFGLSLSNKDVAMKKQK